MTPAEEIKSRLDIAEFVRGYVKLEKSGQNWRALCPFHAEKTPSFFVSPSRQSWHCFGACQTGGDIFSFLMKIENLEFPEALKILAEKAGVTIQRENPRFRAERNLLAEILEHAARFYETKLASAEAPRKYLIGERGLNEETIKTFRLGWAPPEWKALLEDLTNAGFKPQDIERAGLVVRNRDGGYFDRFRGRIMFPLFDTTGRVIGFTGRIFLSAGAGGTGDPSAAKYVNTPETPLFQKSKLLYGYHRAKSAIARENAALLVEGQMDFLAAWQEGIQNVIAASGTALTEAHLRQLRRICDTIILGFDMDSAGQTATERGVLLAASSDFTIKILTLPGGKDVADFVRAAPGQLAELIKTPKHLIQYYFENLRAKFQLESIEGKTRAAAYILPRLKTLASPSERALWMRELAAITGIREDALFEDLARAPSLLTDSFASFEAESTNDLAAGSAPRKARKEMLAERSLAFALGVGVKPPFAVGYVAYFPERWRDLAYQFAANAAPETGSDMVKYLGMRLDYEYSLKPDLNLSAELQLSLKSLKELALKEKRAELSAALVRAEAANDPTETLKISDEINKLNQEIRNG